MATKFYLRALTTGLPAGTLPSAEQSSLTVTSGGNFEANQNTNRALSTTKGAGQSDLQKSSIADTNTNNYYIARWVSPVLYQTNITAQTWSFEFAAKESNAAANFPVTTSAAGRVNIYVWKPSDGTKVGTILDGNTGTISEAGTSQTVISGTFSGSAVTGMTPGDACIIIEWWAVVTQGNGTQRTLDFYFDGTTENSTSNEAAFISTPENLLLTRELGNATLLVSAGSAASTANTTQYAPMVGNAGFNTTEAITQYKIRRAGKLSKLSVNLAGNSVTGTSTFTVRKNGVDTSLVASATSTGNATWEDLVNTVSVAAGDLINLKCVPGAATNTYTIGTVTCVFTPDDGSMAQLLEINRVSTPGFDQTSNGATGYMGINGGIKGYNNEADAKVRIRKAGTFQNFAVYVSVNNRTSTTTIRSRKNGSNGNCVLSIGAGVTGLIEDTNHVDTVAAGDDYCYSYTTGAGSGETITYQFVQCEFIADDFSGMLSSGGGDLTAINANVTQYIGLGGNVGNTNTTENNYRRRNRVNRCMLTDLVVNVPTNGVTATSTFTVRKNGADTGITVSFTSGQTGIQSDTTHTAEIGSGDDIDIKVVTGATGTSLTVGNIVIYYKMERITKQFRFPYNILGRISKPFIYKFNVVARVSKSFIYKFNVLKRISKSFIYKFNVLARITKPFIYKFNVVHRTSKAFIYKFNVVQRVSKIFRYRFNVTVRITKSFIYKFNVLQRISKPFVYKFNVQQRISKIFRYRFNVVQRISKPFVYKFNVLQRISKSFIYLFNVQQALQRVSKPFIYKFNVVQRTSKSFVYKFNIQQRISKSFIYKFNVLKRITKSFIYKFNVVQRVSKIFRYRFNVVQRISKPFVYKFNVTVRVTKSFIYKFNVVQRIGKPFTYKFNVQKRISKAFVYKFNVTVRVTKSFIYKFNVQQRISKDFTYLFNIVSATIRVSKSFTYLFNVVQRTSKSFTYPFNVTTRVTKAFRYPFNITVRVTKSFTYKFNVVKRVSKSFIYKFNVVQRISKPFTYKFNVVQRVSKQFRYKFNVTVRLTKQFIYKFNINNLVSKSFTYKFNITKRVSKSFTYPFNVVQRISKEFTYVFNIKGQIQLLATFAETISINFSQGFGEIFVSGRESINVLRKFFS